MRLLVVNHTSLFGGAERNLCDLLSRLPEDQVQVLAVVAPGHGPAVDVMNSLDIRCIDLPVPCFAGKIFSISIISELIKWLRFQSKLRKLLIDEKPDLIYANSPHAAIAVELILEKQKFPLVWQIPDLIKDSKFNRLALRRVFQKSGAIIAVSRATASSIIRLGANPLNVHLVYCGVESKDFDLVAEGSVRLRNELGIETNAPVIGMFGQLTQWKGWHVLIEAIPQVVNIYPDAQFIFVGRAMVNDDKLYVDRLKKRLNSLRIAKNVHWLGFRSDVPRIMLSCDVIVHASIKPEPLGVVIMEGMAAGKPVICTRGGGTSEMNVNRETGLIVEPGNHNDLGKAINFLIRHPEIRLQMGNRGRQIADKEFTHEKRVEGYLRIFNQLIISKK